MRIIKFLVTATICWAFLPIILLIVFFACAVIPFVAFIAPSKIRLFENNNFISIK